MKMNITHRSRKAEKMSPTRRRLPLYSASLSQRLLRGTCPPHSRQPFLTEPLTPRFVNDRFNLDLSYITRRLVVMAFPGGGMKGMGRNNLRDVKKFFDERHPHGYMVSLLQAQLGRSLIFVSQQIYNLNTDPEYCYDDGRFDGRVRHFAFADHAVSFIPSLPSAPVIANRPSAGSNLPLRRSQERGLLRCARNDEFSL